jgi:RND family efflux transporter MFP subunit
MKQLKYIGITLLVAAGIIAILLHNKAAIQAKTNAEVKDAYYVSTAKAINQKISENISFVGTVAANGDVNIVSETQGKVTGLFFKVGEFKKAGSVLVQIDDELKRASYQTAEANYQKAKKDYDRYKALLDQKSVTETQFDQVKIAYVTAESQYIVAKRQLNDTKITTPISGVVTARNVDLGTMVQNGMSIGNVVDISRLKVKVGVAEKDAFKLKVGDKVDITTEVFPGVKIPGTVETISAKGDEAHTYPVEIVIVNNGKEQLRAGMFARVEFTSLKHDEALIIPRSAIIGSSRDAKVYVIEGGIAKLRTIQLGGEYGLNAEVLSGLRAGEEVVTSGQNVLQDNVKVTVVAQ